MRLGGVDMRKGGYINPINVKFEAWLVTYLQEVYIVNRVAIVSESLQLKNRSGSLGVCFPCFEREQLYIPGKSASAR